MCKFLLAERGVFAAALCCFGLMIASKRYKHLSLCLSEEGAQHTKAQDRAAQSLFRELQNTRPNYSINNRSDLEMKSETGAIKQEPTPLCGCRSTRLVQGWRCFAPLPTVGIKDSTLPIAHCNHIGAL